MPRHIAFTGTQGYGYIYELYAPTVNTVAISILRRIPFSGFLQWFTDVHTTAEIPIVLSNCLFINVVTTGNTPSQ